MTPTEAERDGLVAWLEGAATYFEKRPTNDEDRAHWANVFNAENCRKATARIAHLEVEIVHWKKQAGAAASNAALLQQDCARHVADKARKDEALRECQAALAMMISPDAIKQSTPMIAWSVATAAEAKARAALSPEGGWQCPIDHHGCTSNCGSYGCGN